ncbi:MAG: DUF4159 domain-containing protein [Alphaproteobacteria bacterium]|nr:DUF4159 domain-containing protein [Alphaproteobacteria bacterium]
MIFIDDGWTAAAQWDERKSALEDQIDNAARASRGIALVAASQPGKPVTLLDAGAAARVVREIKPVPYIPDRLKTARALAAAKFASKPAILWLSDGLDEGNARQAADMLSRAGALRVLADPFAKLPIALRPPADGAGGFSAVVFRAGTNGSREGQVTALGARDEDLASGHFAIADGQGNAVAKIVLPLEIRNETVRLAIRGQDSAGAVQLLDQGAARRAIGLVSLGGSENAQPLLSDIFYLERALAPYADVRKGTIADLLSRNPSVLIIADVGRIAGVDHDRVAEFVANGGELIRFAGARMTNDVDDLVPVRLRLGGRYLGGALAWASPQRLAPFSGVSPFAGLSIPSDVTVSRQILAEPSIALSDRSWARLEDGTPLVTAQQRGKGLIVLVHVTASPAWSTLPLSGLYVEMLRRMIALSGSHQSAVVQNPASLPAIATLDGFGHMQPPAADISPIPAGALARAVAGPEHPPGLYGPEGAARALNAVTKDTSLSPFGDLGARVEAYTGARAKALGPQLLSTALVLFLIDLFLSLWIRGHIAVPAHMRRALTSLVLVLLAMHVTAARSDDKFDSQAALDTRLAYVTTGLPDVDQISRSGLIGLGAALKERTSYEPEAPVGVDIARDELSFFPLLYWPMDPREKELSPEAISRIAQYMQNGGTILFDTRDLTLGAVRGANSPGEQTLRRLLAKLDIPPLEPVPGDHVLTKAFYLLNEFPGRWDGGKVWVEALPPPDPNAAAPARGGDGVSPVIIGGNDWAAAWAVDASGKPTIEVVPGGDRQRELALRFGVNVVMYALTGNYKTDVVHWPALLERLGK